MTVVIGYVRTAEGEAALAAALEQLHEGERLVVVNKPEPAELGDEFSAEQDSDALHNNLAELGIDAEVVNLYADDEPADLIVEQATVHEARLVVIGLRKRSPVGKILLGSTAQAVLFNAPCPVLSVRATPTE
jgi:nucleotide-binding universal stress UspA family protein